VGLIVNAASEVLKIAPSEIEAPGIFSPKASPAMLPAWANSKPPHYLLDIAKLLHRPEFKRFEEAANSLVR